MGLVLMTPLLATIRARTHHACSDPNQCCSVQYIRVYEDVSTQSDNYHDQQLVTDEHVPCRIAPSEVRRCECSRHDDCHFDLIDPRMLQGRVAHCRTLFLQTFRLNQLHERPSFRMRIFRVRVHELSYCDMYDGRVHVRVLVSFVAHCTVFGAMDPNECRPDHHDISYSYHSVETTEVTLIVR